MGASRTSAFGFIARTVSLLLVAFCALVGWRIMTSSRIAEAATDTYYPSFCLGGWDKPRYASGPVETGNGDDPAAFTLDNSAFLASDISSQLFCGYFPVEPRDNPPVSAEIRLVWSFQDTQESSTPSGPAPMLTEPAPVPSEATTTKETPPATFMPSATETPEILTAPAPENETTPAPGADAGPRTPADTDPPVPTSGPQPAPDAPPAPVAAPTPDAPTESAPTSLLQTGLRIAGTWIANHTPAAHAQENVTSPISLSDWFEVSYSLDGVRWKSLGRVNSGNWKDFTVRIPLTSWDDLQNVQIMVAALPSLSERPAVYLDGMELRVDAPLSVSETASAAASAANDMVDSAADAITSLGSKIASIFGNDTPVEPTPTHAAAAPSASIPKIKKRVLQFSISGASVPVSSRLPWQDKTAQEGTASTTRTNMPEVNRSDDGRSFIVSGGCSKDFATVITYRNETDYRDNPRNALANVATPCENGRYTFNLGGLPDSTQGGTYYLLIGEQSATGTWTPASALLPITIAPVEVEE